jgi:alpha-galactosidase
LRYSYIKDKEEELQQGRAMRLTHPIRFYGSLIFGLLVSLTVHAAAFAATPAATIRFDATSKVFRLDAAGTTYAFGINDQDELQPIYWGSAIATIDRLAAAAHNAGAASFDLPSTTTQNEYAGWGAELYP